jgi:hypothetical protein
MHRRENQWPHDDRVRLINRPKLPWEKASKGRRGRPRVNLRL